MMKKIIYIVSVLLLIIIGLAYVGVQLLMSRGRPQYNGRIVVSGGVPGADVTVYRDEHGVAHIKGATERDVYFALGYVHAQERLVQMELTRRAAGGRLTEIVGDSPTDPGMLGHESLLEQDRFNRVVGFADIASRAREVIDPESMALVEAYAAGVNLYLERAKKLPPEFTLLGYKPAPWTPEDTFTIGRLIAWGLSHNMSREVARILAIGELGVENGWNLFPRYPNHGPYIIEPSVKKYHPRGKLIERYPLPLPPEYIKGPLATALLNIKDDVAAGPGIRGFDMASNSWVVDGTRSASGKPILSNDPHLINMLPSIFFETRLLSDDGLDVIGVSFPGMPFIALGHNRHVAWGATTTRADVQDLFVERVNPDNPDEYMHRGEWKKFESREEVFKIKTKDGMREEKIIVRKTVHGTVLNEILPELGKDAPPVALAWAGYYPSDDIKGFFGLARAGSAAEIKASFAIIGSPVQNWVYADDQGNIGYFASGYYPMRARGDGTLPVPGWTGDYDWLGFLPVDEIPQIDNPANGVIVTANNAVLPEKDYPFVVSFNYQYYRAARIKELLAGTDRLTPDDMAKMQADVYSKQAERLAPVFVGAFDSAGDKSDPVAVAAAEVLRKWDFRCAPDSVGASVFYWAYRAALDLVYKDDLSESLYIRFLRTQALDNSIDDALETGLSPFMDNKKTPEVETRDEIVAAAVAAAAHGLSDRFGKNPKKWAWGKIHKVYFTHPFAGVPGLSMLFPNHVMDSTGSRETIFNAYFFWDKDLEHGGIFNAAAGPAFRQVIDMADVAGARMIIDSGQGGHPRSKHIFDQYPLWNSGGLIPMNMDMDSIVKRNKGKLVFQVQGK